MRLRHETDTLIRLLSELRRLLENMCILEYELRIVVGLSSLRQQISEEIRVSQHKQQKRSCGIPMPTTKSVGYQRPAPRNLDDQWLSARRFSTSGVHHAPDWPRSWAESGYHVSGYSISSRMSLLVYSSVRFPSSTLQRVFLPFSYTIFSSPTTLGLECLPRPSSRASLLR